MLPLIHQLWVTFLSAGIESFSKLGDSIYFEEMGSTPGLYIVQFIPSSFNWKSGGISINQKIEPVNSWEPNLRLSFTILSPEVFFSSYEELIVQCNLPPH